MDISAWDNVAVNTRRLNNLIDFLVNYRVDTTLRAFTSDCDRWVHNDLMTIIMNNTLLELKNKRFNQWIALKYKNRLRTVINYNNLGKYEIEFEILGDDHIFMHPITSRRVRYTYSATYSAETEKIEFYRFKVDGRYINPTAEIADGSDLVYGPLCLLLKLVYTESKHFPM